MKKHLFILLAIASCCGAKGQAVPIAGSTEWTISSKALGKRPAYLHDTVPCLMVCQDTTHFIEDIDILDYDKYDSTKNKYGIPYHTEHRDVGRNRNAWMLSGRDGFEVREVIPQPWREDSKDVYYEHVAYLDADKKELPKTTIVWMSKKITP